MKTLQIGKKLIGLSNPTFIIAELSANHGGNIENAKRIIEAAAESGADAVKLQTYTADTMTIDSEKEDFQINSGTAWDGKTLHTLYNEAFTPWEWHKELKDYANGLGMEFFSTPFDETAVNFLEELGLPCYKIASFENNDIPLIKEVAKTGKPVIISTGMATFEDIKLAVDTIRGEGNEQIVLLKCTSSYPAPYDQMNLKTIESFQNDFDVIPGLSDHTLGIEVPIASIVLGAKVIEKHFCLSRDIPTPDSHFSLEPSEFKQMVKSIRNVEKAIGKTFYNISDKEKSSVQFKRSIYIVENVKKGDKITKDNIRIIRPGYGLAPKYYEDVLGKTFNQNIEKGTRLSLDLIS